MWTKIQNKILELVQHDKALHFMFGFIVFVVSSHFFLDVVAFGITFLIALIKEIRDHIVYKGFDIADLIFTTIPSIILITLR